MISDKIKALRTNAQMSQAELAKKLSLTRASINAWEMGISIPSTQYIVELSQLFCVSADYILDMAEDTYINASGLSVEQLEIIKKLINHFNEENAKYSDIL